MHLRTRAIKIADNCRHTSLISHSSGQVDGLLGIIFGEALDLEIELVTIGPVGYLAYLAAVPARTLTWEEGQ